MRCAAEAAAVSADTRRSAGEENDRSSGRAPDGESELGTLKERSRIDASDFEAGSDAASDSVSRCHPA